MYAKKRDIRTIAASDLTGGMTIIGRSGFPYGILSAHKTTDGMSVRMDDRRTVILPFGAPLNVI